MSVQVQEIWIKGQELGEDQGGRVGRVASQSGGFERGHPGQLACIWLSESTQQEVAAQYQVKVLILMNMVDVMVALKHPEIPRV